MVDSFEPSESSTRSRHRVVPLAPVRRRRVALADDERNIREILESILSDEGYDVRTASDGLALLELVESFDPDVVLTDLSMPRMSGLEVLLALRERRSRARVVLMTAWPASNGQRDLHGASAVLHKPFQIHDLLAALGPR